MGESTTQTTQPIGRVHHLDGANGIATLKVESAQQPAVRRIHYLDGLRGVASVGVCLWHHFLAFFPGAVMPAVPMHAPWLEKYVYRSPLDILFAGDFSVFIFFMLSGFVISVKFFGKCDMETLKKSYFRRYIRLMPPALVTILASYIIMANGWMFNKQAGDLANSWWLQLNWSAVDVSLYNALHAGLYDIWFIGVPVTNHFNSTLGTLQLELLGSYIVFTVIYVCAVAKISYKNRYWCHLVLIALALFLRVNDPHYAVFFVGMAAADVFQNSPEVFTRLRPFGLIFLLAGIFLGTINIGNLPFAPYHWIDVLCRLFGMHPLSYPWALGAVLLVLGVMLVPTTQRLLEGRFCQFLGAYSYALFVTHTVLLGSLTCFLFVRFREIHALGYNACVLLSFLVALPVLLLATHLVKKVDDLAINASRKI
jgi:peptidoglycan/LPS O-acetylase OafA/YrhL